MDIDNLFVQRQLKELSTVFKQRLTEVGEESSEDEIKDDAKSYKIVNIITEFAIAYKAQIDGRSRKIVITTPCGIFLDIIRLIKLMKNKY